MTEADLARIAAYMPQLLSGAAVTVPVGIAAMALCTALATLAALTHSSRRRAVRTFGRVYIEIARATPDIVQVYIWYYLLAEFGVQLPAVVAGILALGFGHGGSLAEVIRGGIEAVDRHQWDASRVLGMNSWQVWWRVVLPQVARIILPVWTGYVVAMFKSTAFLSLVAVSELMAVADEIGFLNFRFFEVYAITLFIYAAIGVVAIALIRTLQRAWSTESPRLSRAKILETSAPVA